MDLAYLFKFLMRDALVGFYAGNIIGITLGCWSHLVFVKKAFCLFAYRLHNKGFILPHREVRPYFFLTSINTAVEQKIIVFATILHI